LTSPRSLRAKFIAGFIAVGGDGTGVHEISMRISLFANAGANRARLSRLPYVRHRQLFLRDFAAKTVPKPRLQALCQNRQAIRRFAPRPHQKGPTLINYKLGNVRAALLSPIATSKPLGPPDLLGVFVRVAQIRRRAFHPAATRQNGTSAVAFDLHNSKIHRRTMLIAPKAIPPTLS